MRDALNRTGRQIFYSMEGQSFFPDVGNMVRTGGDIWPEWDKCVLRNLYSNNAQASLFTAGRGFFLDPDMLQATGTEGGTSLTFEEARSQFALWAVMKAPLILGAHYSLLATMRTAQPQYFELLTHPELIALNQDIAQQAVLRQSMPSTLQQAPGSALNVSLQACDASRGDQRFIPGAAPSSIQSLHGSLCLSAAPGAAAQVLASPCNSTPAQAWPGLAASRLSVAQAAGQAGMCLGVGPQGRPATAACIYTGSLPPPFELNLGSQLWLWDRKGACKPAASAQRARVPARGGPLLTLALTTGTPPHPTGSLIHGESGLCATLGLPNLGDSTYTTNAGTLHFEVWAGPTSAGKTVAVLFNKGPLEDTVAVDWEGLGLPVPLGTLLPVRDVWAMADLPPAGNLSAVVAPHGVRVFVVG